MTGATPLPSVLGSRPLTRQHVVGVLFSSATYLLYGGITAAQVGFGLLAPAVGGALVAVGLLMNVLFFVLVRSGRFDRGRDPGLGRTQLVAGIVLMYAAYATLGRAAPAMLIVMASHIVYSMFSMTPKAVWRLVLASLLGLAATMTACHAAWPERYPLGLQVVSFLYAALVVPLIALLADRITAMTQRLKSQHAELERVNDQLRELATRDELTQVHNRRHMAELLAHQVALHRRQGTPLALALLDIDHFKRVNDQHGHAAGDEVLRRFAAFARGELRASDLLARWGGEEFLVLMPGATREAGLAVMERLQQRLAATSAGLMPAGLAVSFSAGVVQWADGESADTLVERADHAMYRAKTGGRARSEVG